MSFGDWFCETRHSHAVAPFDMVKLLVSSSIYTKKDRNGFSMPMKSFLQLSPDVALQFAPVRCTHPPPPVPPFLLKQVRRSHDHDHGHVWRKHRISGQLDLRNRKSI